MKFSLAKAGMMKDFAGFFSVQPYSRQALNAGNVDSSPRSEKPWWAGGKFDFPGVPSESTFSSIGPCIQGSQDVASVLMFYVQRQAFF